MSDYLIHYGIKGMKWGVRKQRPTSGHSRLHRVYKAKIDKKNARMYKQAQGYKELAKFYNSQNSQGNSSLHRASSASKAARYQRKADKLLSKIGDYKIENSSKQASKKTTYDLAMSRAKMANPNLSYNKIYKEMGVNIKSEDPDVYREAETEWLKKHGYMK